MQVCAVRRLALFVLRLETAATVCVLQVGRRQETERFHLGFHSMKSASLYAVCPCVSFNDMQHQKVKIVTPHNWNVTPRTYIHSNCECSFWFGASSQIRIKQIQLAPVCFEPNISLSFDYELGFEYYLYSLRSPVSVA